jgi:1-deoxy-D-xylulose-5-phosphate synthase
MDYQILPRISSPNDLRLLSRAELVRLADEIREALCSVVETRPAHFASNLGVVELCLALHLAFDFSKDRLIWDTGHQIYPHKLVTGRFDRIASIRERGGLMGFPNPAESDYDLFMTGHAGSSVSTVLGLKAGDDLLRPEENRKSVAVIGDGALPSGIVFEAINNAAELNKDVLVILNDNKMGICPRVGGLGQYLDKSRRTSASDRLADIGSDVAEHRGALFTELGFHYVGPVDGHDLFSLVETLKSLKDVRGPVLLHVFTEKGRGFAPACSDPVKVHAPNPFRRSDEGRVVPLVKSSNRAYTDVVSSAIHQAMAEDDAVCVLTAAMCAGNKLEKIRADFPKRFFDVGICEGHAVAFAAGMAKAGAKPIVDIYSTFLQRSFDQIFQEVALQNLPVVFTLDRGGLSGPDGPTHHGVFDNAYMRIFPNMAVMAPGDELDVEPMLGFALNHVGPTSLRYPKASAERVDRRVSPVEHGKAEVFRWGKDAMLVAYGALFPACVAAATRLSQEGLEVGVINARFVKPIDIKTIGRAIRESRFLLTIEENTLPGGFGSAVLEAANAAGLRTDHIRTLGLPDRFVEHGDREELLADFGLDADGITATVRSMIDRRDWLMSLPLQRDPSEQQIGAELSISQV